MPHVPSVSSHVLDTYHGTPAPDMRYELLKLDCGDGAVIKVVATGRTDSGGRWGGHANILHDGPGCYRLRYFVAEYFAARGVELPEFPFVGVVSLDFGVVEGHYHVPLITSPWSYGTYRGS